MHLRLLLAFVCFSLLGQSSLSLQAPSSESYDISSGIFVIITIVLKEASKWTVVISSQGDWSPLRTVVRSLPKGVMVYVVTVCLVVTGRQRSLAIFKRRPFAHPLPMQSRAIITSGQPLFLGKETYSLGVFGFWAVPYLS